MVGVRDDVACLCYAPGESAGDACPLDYMGGAGVHVIRRERESFLPRVG